MAGISNRSPLAPTAVPPSVQSSVYETKFADNPMRRGPLRFEEGIATDTDVPNDFILGMRQGYVTDARGHNANVYIKDAADTQRERVHMGSSSWVEAPTFLQAFSGGASNEAERNYIQVGNSGGRSQRHSPAVVRD
jgi:hypothetical protein